MNDQKINEIDYDDMDDLQLSDRLGWNELSDNEIIPDDMDIDSSDHDIEYNSLNFDHNNE